MKLSSVFFYVPNIIGECQPINSVGFCDDGCALFKIIHTHHPGYIRLILLIFCWIFFNRFVVCLPLYMVSTFLDGKI